MDKQGFVTILEMVALVCTVIVSVIHEEDKKKGVSDAGASGSRPVR